MTIHVWGGLQDVKFGELIFKELKTSIYITGQVFQFSTGPHYQWRKHAGTPKYVFMAHEMALLDVGACVRWPETGMSTRLWTIQYKMMTYSGHRSNNTGTGTTAHFLSCRRCVWFPWHISSIQWWAISSSQLVLSASYAGGKHRFWLSLLLGGHVETTMCERFASVLGSVSFC